MHINPRWSWYSFSGSPSCHASSHPELHPLAEYPSILPAAPRTSQGSHASRCCRHLSRWAEQPPAWAFSVKTLLTVPRAGPISPLGPFRVWLCCHHLRGAGVVCVTLAAPSMDDAGAWAPREWTDWTSKPSETSELNSPITHLALHSRSYGTLWDFPGGPGVKNPPSNAEDSGLIPGQGTKIPHAMEQLSPRATTEEAACCSGRLRMTQWRAVRHRQGATAHDAMESRAPHTRRNSAWRNGEPCATDKAQRSHRDARNRPSKGGSDMPSHT